MRRMYGEHPDFDERDEAIRQRRIALLNRREGPRCGDYVEFADGVVRRVSHVWCFEPDGYVQTSTDGSFYLGDGHVSFSGALFPGVSSDTLTKTEQTRPGHVWFFHHDYPMAFNGVNTKIDFRVYTCSMNAPM